MSFLPLWCPALPDLASLARKVKEERGGKRRGGWPRPRATKEEEAESVARGHRHRRQGQHEAGQRVGRPRKYYDGPEAGANEGGAHPAAAANTPNKGRRSPPPAAGCPRKRWARPTERGRAPLPRHIDGAKDPRGNSANLNGKDRGTRNEEP